MPNIIFKLNAESLISIQIPDMPKKFNYYYEPTTEIHQFDEATTFFIKKNKKLELAKDVLQEAILPFNFLLKKALIRELYLPTEIKPGEVGKELNKSYNERPYAEVSSFLLWETVKHVSTLLYNFNDLIYLEIAPTYKWSYLELKKNEKYITFDEFLKTYKPYYVEIIPHDVAFVWQKQCEDIIKKTEIDKAYSITE